jgi:hypothetical protein
VFVYRLTVPIDDFDGLITLGRWFAGPTPQRISRTAWTLRALLALADAADQVAWNGDMRHLPLIGVLPTSYQTTPYLVIKQDNNGDTFLVTEAEPDWIDQPAARVEVPHRTIGAWEPAPTDIEDIPDVLCHRELGTGLGLTCGASAKPDTLQPRPTPRSLIVSESGPSRTVVAWPQPTARRSGQPQACSAVPEESNRQLSKFMHPQARQSATAFRRACVS